jgi:hypothetical protein
LGWRRLEAADAEKMRDIYEREEMAAVMAARIDWKDTPKSEGGVCLRVTDVTPATVTVDDECAAATELRRLGSRTVDPRRVADERSWRNFYDSSGVVIAPPFTPPSDRRR